LIFYSRIHLYHLSKSDLSLTACSSIVGGHVGFAEVELREQMKQAGGKWNRSRKVWELRYEHIVAPKLEARIVEAKASNSRY
jgi:hypothetical protein